MFHQHLRSYKDERLGFESQTKDWRSFDFNSTRPYQLKFTLFMRLSNIYIYKLSVSNDFVISAAYV